MSSPSGATHTSSFPSAQAASARGGRYLTWRLCAWAAPVFLVGYVLSWGVLGFNIPPIDPSMAIGDLHAHYVDHNTRIKLAMILGMFFGPFYFVFSAVLSRVLQKIEGPDGPLSIVEQIGGALTTVVVLVAGCCWLTAALRIDERTPEIIRTLHDFGWMFFDMTFMATGLQLCAVGIVVLLDKRSEPLFPRWLAWLSFVAATIFVPVALVGFFFTGPFAWNGLFNFWIGLNAFFLWAVLFAIYLFKAIDRLEREEAA